MPRHWRANIPSLDHRAVHRLRVWRSVILLHPWICRRWKDLRRHYLSHDVPDTDHVSQVSVHLNTPPDDDEGASAI